MYTTSHLLLLIIVSTTNSPDTKKKKGEILYSLKKDWTKVEIPKISRNKVVHLTHNDKINFLVILLLRPK